VNESTIHHKDYERFSRRKKHFIIIITVMFLVLVSILVVILHRYVPTAIDHVRWLVESYEGRRYLFSALALTGFFLLICQAVVLAARFTDSLWLKRGGARSKSSLPPVCDANPMISTTSAIRRELHMSRWWPEWTVRVTDELGGRAVVRFAVLREQGTIVAGKGRLRIRNRSWFGEAWILQCRGEVCATAERKRMSFAKDSWSNATHYEVQAEGKVLTLSLSANGYQIQAQGQILGYIRRTNDEQGAMDCSDSVPDHVQLFLVWLAQLSRRSRTQTS